MGATHGYKYATLPRLTGTGSTELSNPKPPQTQNSPEGARQPSAWGNVPCEKKQPQKNDINPKHIAHQKIPYSR